MSHDRGWRAACDITIWILCFHFEIHEAARGVTAMVVGSGAWLGIFRALLPVESKLSKNIVSGASSEERFGVTECFAL